MNAQDSSRSHRRRKTDSGSAVGATGDTTRDAPADVSGADPVVLRSLLSEPTRPRTHYGWEILLVLGVSLGRSAVYSVLSIVDRMTVGVPLNEQTTTINNSVTPDRPWLDLAYQLVGVVMPLVPVALALYLLHLSRDRVEIGFDLRRPGFDLSRGALVFVAIAIPGLAFFYAAKAIGINADVSATGIASHWWTIPVLILLACMNGVLEEVIMLGFLFNRLRHLGWGPVAYILVSALIRGSYHLYQGFGGFAGNVVMGIVFGLLYLHWRRVGPLVVAHSLLDIGAFVGYAALSPVVDWL
jgi:membrane protease YdiL (CAAX protease family)